MVALLSIALALAGSGEVPWRIVGEDGKPFALRAPVVELAPESVIEVATRKPSRLDLFAPRAGDTSDAPFRQDGIRLNDNVANALILTGGAILLGTILADWAKHQHW